MSSPGLQPLVHPVSKPPSEGRAVVRLVSDHLVLPAGKPSRLFGVRRPEAAAHDDLRGYGEGRSSGGGPGRSNSGDDFVNILILRPIRSALPPQCPADRLAALGRRGARHTAGMDDLKVGGYAVNGPDKPPRLQQGFQLTRLGMIDPAPQGRDAVPHVSHASGRWARSQHHLGPGRTASHKIPFSPVNADGAVTWHM